MIKLKEPYMVYDNDKDTIHILWSMVIQFNACSNKDKEAMVGVLLRNLKEGVDL